MWGLKVLLALLDRKAPKVHPAQLALADLKAQRVHKARKALKEMMDQPDLRDKPDRRA